MSSYCQLSTVYPTAASSITTPPNRKFPTDLKKPPAKTTEIESLIRELLDTQEQGKAQSLARLELRVKQGKLLRKLKEMAPHGEWLELLQKTGFDERSAQRLMILPGTAIDQIRTTDPDLAICLPDDLQRLAELAKLALSQLIESLSGGGWYKSDLSRREVAENVKAVLADIQSVAAGAVQAEVATDTDDRTTLLRNTPRQFAIKRQEQPGMNLVEDNEVDAAHSTDTRADSVESQIKPRQDACVDRHDRTGMVFDCAESICAGVVKLIKKRLKASDSSLWPESISQQNDLLGEVLDALPTVFRKTQGPLSKSHA